MERIGFKTTDPAEADAWSRRQRQQLTPDERRAIARQLRARVFGPDPPDVRSVDRSVHTR